MGCNVRRIKEDEGYHENITWVFKFSFNFNLIILRKRIKVRILKKEKVFYFF